MDVERASPPHQHGRRGVHVAGRERRGRRLVATVSRSTAHLWRLPISARVMTESDATRLAIPTTAVCLARGPGYIVIAPRRPPGVG